MAVDASDQVVLLLYCLPSEYRIGPRSLASHGSNNNPPAFLNITLNGGSFLRDVMPPRPSAAHRPWTAPSRLSRPSGASSAPPVSRALWLRLRPRWATWPRFSMKLARGSYDVEQSYFVSSDPGTPFRCAVNITKPMCHTTLPAKARLQAARPGCRKTPTCAPRTPESAHDPFPRRSAGWSLAG